METTRRKSRQRERIYELIKSSTDHPTAQIIYDTLKLEISALSMGNVYRNIRILIEQGLVVSRDFGDGVEHFDAMTHMHYHFVCEKCRRAIDFTMPVQESITRDAQKLSKHTITGHTIQFFGICDKCRAKKKKN
ncbi:MAG TPA: transcriptional repressor [Spirochaetota bacterium]|nr:transcriptional repressor [Spirochaetota bacterium]HQO40255.1 transcriptional repressor [Spirochaetota bacterium]